MWKERYEGFKVGDKVRYGTDDEIYTVIKTYLHHGKLFCDLEYNDDIYTFNRQNFFNKV